MNILIRDVPDEVRDALAAAARAQGQSMQAYLNDVLESQARASRNAEILDSVRATGGGTTDPDDVISVVRASRDAADVWAEQRRQAGPA